MHTRTYGNLELFKATELNIVKSLLWCRYRKIKNYWSICFSINSLVAAREYRYLKSLWKSSNTVGLCCSWHNMLFSICLDKYLNVVFNLHISMVFKVLWLFSKWYPCKISIRVKIAPQDPLHHTHFDSCCFLRIAVDSAWHWNSFCSDKVYFTPEEAMDTTNH